MAPAVLLSPNHGLPDTLVGDAFSSDSLCQALLDSPQDFLQPSSQLHAASLALAKHYLDPLAASVSEAQTARLQSSRRKRKRGEADDRALRDVLKLKQLHLDGFAVDHVWEQAKRVLDASQREVQRSAQESKHLKHQRAAQPLDQGATTKKRVSFAADAAGSAAEPGEGPFGEGSASDSDTSHLDEAENDDADIAGTDGSDGDVANTGEDPKGFEEDSSTEYFDAAETVEEFVPDRHGLNDGFFSIDDFNQQTEFLERQDAKGDPDDGAASDEEDIDWSVDPASQPLPSKMENSKETEEQLSEEESEEEDGPTFGNADLSAPFDSDDDDEEIGEGDLDIEDPASNTNDIFYGDFFAPPPQPKSKSKKRKAAAKKKPPLELNDDAIEQDIERAISDVRRDIFEDDEELSLSGEEDQANQNQSSHERRKAALAAQIRSLEAEAVAKREWAMSGEARAADRPLNSLLEEDLEFERAGKPVPIITPEVSSSIEELIKQRIIARQFDEVTKRLPGSEHLAQSTARRGLADIDERNHDQGLADIYETEHQRTTDPNFIDKRDAKLKAAHEEIERIWREVSGKLDALSNWHYRPKPADVQVSVVTDAPRITMEDARPGGIGISTEQSGLAPQEIYKAGGEHGKDEIATKGGTVVGTAELSREEKLRRRRREKERSKKRAGNTKPVAQGQTPAVSKAQEKKGVVEDLKKGGVKVIGKGGELVDVEGEKIKAATTAKGASSFKL